VILAGHGLDDQALLGVLRRCKELSVKVSLVPEMFDVMGPSVEIDEIEGVTLLGLNPPVLSRTSRLAKRCMDVALSAVALVVLAPVMVAVAIAVRLDSRGPVLFRQRRRGKGGVEFDVFKFRTMVLDAEGRRSALLAQSNDPDWLLLDDDPRITRAGRVLRPRSLDELPQLWNVLRGEMSLVGPRPLVEDEDRRVEDWARVRLDLTPGITGLWQVLGRTRIPFEEMVKLDYLYVTNWSLWGDVRLLVRTLPAVLMQRGAN
jgi:exopolysaccharide biosynthesis polyprenyl glycosylphosphotransferase